MPDVVIIGDGLIGLSTALQLSRVGADVQIVGAGLAGAASTAAAGLLSPSVGDLSDSVRAFFFASLDLYPDFVALLAQYDARLKLVEGLIEVSSSPDEAELHDSESRRLSNQELSRIEPGLAHVRSAILHASNGAVDNVRLLQCLRRAVVDAPRVSAVSGDVVTAVDLGDPATVITRDGTRLEAKTVVLAAGAWSSQIAGLPRALPVSPLKGQMLAVASTALSHAIMGDEAYLVPRVDETVIGATVERAGFDLTVVPETVAGLRKAAVRLCPVLATAEIVRSWAGLRPATPDLLPIVGPDPLEPSLIYACGHSKNGILLAPITAAVVCSLVLGEPPLVDIEPFSITRFRNLG